MARYCASGSPLVSVPGARTQSAHRASAWGSSGLNIFISYRRRESSGYSGRIYDRLRITLRDELGVPPSSAVQNVYRRLLGEGSTTP